MKTRKTWAAGGAAIALATTATAAIGVAQNGHQQVLHIATAAEARSAPGDLAAAWAKGHLGFKYLYGGCLAGVPSCKKNPRGDGRTDCSGFTSAAWWFGAHVNLPRVAKEQYRATRDGVVTRGNPLRADLRPGDLLFYGTSGNIHHVTLFAGVINGEPMAYSEPRSGAVSKLSPVYRGDFYAATRPLGSATAKKPDQTKSHPAKKQHSQGQPGQLKQHAAEQHVPKVKVTPPKPRHRSNAPVTRPKPPHLSNAPVTRPKPRHLSNAPVTRPKPRHLSNAPVTPPKRRPVTTKVTPPRLAVRQPYSPGQVCGSGYRVIDAYTLSRARVFLLWSGAAKSNCVVTLKTGDVGVSTTTKAWLQPAGKSVTQDGGLYKFYAGPVQAHAPGCVRWGGSDGRSSYTSPQEHCSS